MSAYLGFAAIGEVLKAVAAAGGVVPVEAFPSEGTDEVDPFARSREWRDELANGISWAITAFDCHPDWTSDARARERQKRLTQMMRWSQSIRAALTDNELPLAPYMAGLPPTEMAKMLKGLEASVRRAQSFIGDDPAGPLNKITDDGPKMTAADWFLRGMEKTYEKCFGAAAAVRYDTARTPTGPFLAFIMAAQQAVDDADGGAPRITNNAVALEGAFKRYRRTKKRRTTARNKVVVVL